MQHHKFRFKILFLAFILVLLLGTVGSMLVEGLSLIDAFYFTVITISTVGYGDIHPATSPGKLLSLSVIILGVGTFVSMLGTAIEMFLSEREHRSRMEKLNMVIGVFYSEVGYKLLRIFAEADRDLERIRPALLIKNQWTIADFENAKDKIYRTTLEIDISKVDFDKIRDILSAKRDFLIRLLENPSVLEHEMFTSILWSTFHLSEELSARCFDEEHPESDREHLTGDIQRVYRPLLLQWLWYMRHLKEKYPYLFSLSVRTNPFDKEACVVVK